MNTAAGWSCCFPHRSCDRAVAKSGTVHYRVTVTKLRRNVCQRCTSYISRNLSKTNQSPGTSQDSGGFSRTPDWIRTSDLQSRSLTLYPTELRARSLIMIAQSDWVVKVFCRERNDESGVVRSAMRCVFSLMNPTCRQSMVSCGRIQPPLHDTKSLQFLPFRACCGIMNLHFMKGDDAAHGPQGLYRD